jgi:hypothetical protein
VIQENYEDAKKVIISVNRRTDNYNGQKIKDRETHNDLLNSTQKMKGCTLYVVHFKQMVLSTKVRDVW